MFWKHRYLLVVAALGACSGEPASESLAPSGGAVASCATRAYDHIGGPISLINETGEAVTEKNFKGGHSLVFFGFTYCPDVCPSTLVTIDRALQRLPEGMARPKTILISVDPERDTPEALTEYLRAPQFPDDMTALTGSLSAVEDAAAAFKAGFARIDTPDSLADYTMDHSSIVYLMDEDWSLKTFFTHEATAETIGDCLTETLK
ncbi:MAG: SCO family protein [Hyphomonadaceae bacterium]